MPDLSPSKLQIVRAAVCAIEAPSAPGEDKTLPFGISEIDCRLANGGLRTDALHELAGTSSSLADDATATLFAAGLAARSLPLNSSILWVMSRRDLFAPALAQAGLPPHRVIYADCGKDEDVLAVMEEGIRHGGLATVVGEIVRASMTATRRLQLAAEETATMALMLRRWRRNGEDPLAAPSAAATRWRIGCAPSLELPVPGIARPRWRIELARQRGGEPHHWIMEGTDEAGRLALPAEPQHRTAAADQSRTAA